MTHYAGLGFDPTPGEPGAVEAALTAIADAGGKLGMLMGSVESDLDISGGWSGSAADEFHDNLDDIPRALTSGAESMGRVADALVDWAGRLTDNKRQAEVLDELARELKGQLRRAVAELDRARAALAAARGPAQETAKAAFDRAAVHAVSVNDQFDAVIEQARALQDKHLAQAEATAARIAAASNSDTFEPTGKFAQTVGSIGNVLGEISVWTGRAAFVAALLATGPAGWTAAGALAATTAVSGIGGSGAKLYAKDAGVHSFKNTSTLGLLADGALSVGGPTGTGTRQLLKALRSDGPKGVRELLKKAPRSLPQGLREAVQSGQAGQVAKAIKDAGEARTVREAAESIGRIRAEEMARRDAIEKALEGAGHAGGAAVDTAGLLDRATGGNGLPDGLKIAGRLPDLPSAAGEAANQFVKKTLEKIEGVERPAP